jgi:predicted nucleic-acid-binding protein
MRAIDTNVVVRFLVDDDAEQARRARGLIAAGEIYVPVSVLLETEWVLRAGYGLPASRLIPALRGLAGLPGVTVEDAANAALALDWAEQGMDFADALHLARSSHCSAFVSFDRKLTRRAAAVGALPVKHP